MKVLSLFDGISCGLSATDIFVGSYRKKVDNIINL